MNTNLENLIDALLYIAGLPVIIIFITIVCAINIIIAILNLLLIPFGKKIYFIDLTL